MPNTYTQLLTQLVFAVKCRQSLILEPVRERIEKYICSIASNKKHKPLAIYIMPDHLHFLIGLNPNQSISDLVKEIKHSSNTFINDKGKLISRLKNLDFIFELYFIYKISSVYLIVMIKGYRIICFRTTTIISFWCIIQ